MRTPRASWRTSRRSPYRRSLSCTACFTVCERCCSDADERTDMREQIAQRLRDLAATATAVADRLGPDLERAATLMRDVLRDGGTLFFCGNGGSAADAQHLATEYVVRYMKNRRALPALALT